MAHRPRAPCPHVCWVLKNWHPIDFCPESAYDLLSRLGGFGEDGLLQKVVNESLLHPMTGVSYKPTDCALVLNRPCLRYKNINFKLAGFVRVDGSRYLKADAVERYQEDVSFPGLLDDVLEASKDGTDWRLFGPSVQKKGCWAFMDFAKMRARPPRPPRLAPAPAQPRIAHSRPASQDALRDMAESLDIMLAHDVHGHLDMVGIEVRRTPPCARRRPNRDPPASALRCCAGRLLRPPRGEHAQDGRCAEGRDGALPRLGLRRVPGLRHRRHRRPRRALGRARGAWGGGGLTGRRAGWRGPGGDAPHATLGAWPWITVSMCGWSVHRGSGTLLRRPCQWVIITQPASL